jgi:hypothetical protein
VFAPRARHLLGSLRIREDFENRLGHCSGLARRHKQPIDTLSDELRDPASTHRDDGHQTCQCLHQDQAEGFFDAGVSEEVHRRVQLGHLLVREKAWEHHCIFQSECLSTPPEIFAIGTVAIGGKILALASQNQMRSRFDLADDRKRVEQSGLILVPRETRRGSDDPCIGRNAKPLPHC